MTVVSRFVRLPPARRSLVVRAWLTVAVYRLALSTLPFRWVRSFSTFRPRASRATAGRSRDLADLSWAVSVVSRRVPRATCLTQALALQNLLAREGRPAELQIGVAKAADGAFEAHAWLESEGRVVIGGGDLERFTPLARVVSPVR